jgi:DNA replication protein DnaC
MADVVIELLKTHFRQLRLPTMGQEFEKLARDAASGNQTCVQFLLGLTELELAARAANAVGSRIKNADFPVEKDFDTFDFTALPGLSKPKVLELGRCEWIEQKINCCWLMMGFGVMGRRVVGIGRIERFGRSFPIRSTTIPSPRNHGEHPRPHRRRPVS